MQHDNRCGGRVWQGCVMLHMQTSPGSCEASLIKLAMFAAVHSTQLFHRAASHCWSLTGAAWWEEGSGSGWLALLGSAAMFDDEWLGKEDNTAVLDFLLGEC